MDYGANEFEKKQKQEAAKEGLLKVIGKAEGPDGEVVEIRAVDAMAEAWRQHAVKILQVLDPEAYKKYREMKYAGGDNPSVEQRRSAYRYAVRRALDVTYTKSLAGLKPIN